MRYVAFLRAINLGKVNRVPMGDLRAALGEAGFADVRTHLQSGNVVLDTAKRSPSAIERTIEALLRDEFGVSTGVMVRTGAALEKVAKSNPLVKGRVDPRTLHVAFLKKAPTAAAKRAAARQTFGDDEFVIRGSEVYLRYPHGVAGSTMNSAVFQRALGTPATVRTWNVVTRLVELVRP
ncbi:MAG TPA: DUF1697 domain-containing protein [Acidimicrobiia bacterium]